MLDPVFPFLGVAFVVKVVATYINRKARPKNALHVGEVTLLKMYPVKSMGGLTVSQLQCTQKGFKYPDEPLYDRSFMVVNKNGVFQTARARPKLTSIKLSLQGHHMVLECDGMPPLKLPKVSLRSEAKTLIKTEVFGEAVEGQDCGDAASEWISTCLNKDGYRIIYNMDGILQREINKQPKNEKWNQNAKVGDRAVFHDGYPSLLTTEESLAEVNAKIGRKMPMERYRPNIVVKGSKAFDEDNWDEVWINDTKFTNLKPCDRCMLTTVDPFTGTIDPSGEPLKTLKTFRLDPPNFDESPLFGIHLVLDSCEGSPIKVGDDVYVLKK